MSRCFPFPPPGYERKLRVDDDNLLDKKEGNEKKEKRHKRDKNKEKKEGKDKDKDKSKDRHREKDKDKEKKEKHKHKDKDKKKDKSQSRDERGGSSNTERVGSNSPRNHFTGSSSAHELGQRITYVGVATRIENTVNINDRDKGRGEVLDKLRFDQMANGQRDNGETRLPKVAIVCKSSGVDKKRADICRPMEIDKRIEEKQNHMHQRIEKGVKNKEKNGKIFGGQGFQIDPPKDTEFVQEFGRRIKAENGAGGRQVIAKPSSTNQKGIDSNDKFANCDNAISSHSSQSKEISNFRNGVNRKDGGPKLLVVQNIKEFEERGHQMDSSKKFSIGGLEQRRPEMVRPSDMDKTASIGAMKRNGLGGGVGAMGHKEKIITNNENRNKDETEKAKRGGDTNIMNLSRLGKSDSYSTDYTKQRASLVSIKSLEGVIAKRKEPEPCGFSHDNEVRPSKFPRGIESPQSNTESGRKLQLSATITLCASKQGTPMPDSLGRENKELKVVNDVVGAQQSPPFSTKPLPVKANGPIVSPESPPGSSKSLSSVVDANGIISAHGSPLVSTKTVSPKSKSKSKSKSKDKDKESDRSSKPPSPHPDTKYLSQIYSIPKIDDWSESNGDEWLCGSKSSRLKETNTGSLTDDDGQPQVWAKAVNIESLDIYALPYVISY